MKGLAAAGLLLFSQSAINVALAENTEQQQLYKKIEAIEKQLLALKSALAEQKAEQEVLKQKSRQQKRQANAIVAKSSVSPNKPWQIKSYGNLLFKSHEVFKNTQDLDPQRREFADLERVVIEFKYQFEPQWSMELELEYEHGGTGAALEYDGFEEFGEFESEIEAGGEVIVEKLAFHYQASDQFAVEFGRIFLPVGLGTDLHKPSEYLTTERYWSESTLIPQVWHETGLNLSAKWHNFTAQALVTTGLNSEYFRTYQWISTGHQQRFEQVNADDLALTLRLEYGDIKNASGVGFSYYTSDTTGNRNKINKVAGDGNLSIFSINGVYRAEQWFVKGQYIYGELDDSLAITQANKTTAGLQPGNFAQLGSEAEAVMVEAAYNGQHWLDFSNPFYLFTTYQYANPIKAVEQGLATERFERQELALGVNFFPTKNLVLKAQFAQQDYQQNNLDNTNSFSLAVGYQFSL